MGADCQHLIPDENWKCENCGVLIPQPELPSNLQLNLGDLFAISKLIDKTRVEFDKIIKANTDPLNPEKTRLRIVGGQIMRLPHKMILQTFSTTSFATAKDLGYRGTKERWVEMVMEDTPTLTSATL